LTSSPSPLSADDAAAPASLDALHAPKHHEHEALPLGVKLANLAAVVLPFIGLGVAIVSLWGTAVTWVHLTLLAGMYLVTGLGITIGYHRLFTHRAFETNTPVRAFLAIAGAMAVEGPLFTWVATHRKHHQHADDDHDPHSPHHHGGGILGMLRGLWHAHVGWLFQPEPTDLERYSADLRKDPVLVFINRHFLLWAGLGLLIPAIVGGLLTLSWTGALLGFVWGGLARIFLVHHVTWSVNSVCHFWGSRPFETHDESRNNLLFGVLAFGEGWHNNHHAFPTSARHGLKWWQVDTSYWIIRGMEKLGLAWKVKVPARDAIAAKEQRTQAA
jgi:stearoyl-CoA desaturase (delta-9 desaturase)